LTLRGERDEKEGVRVNDLGGGNGRKTVANPEAYA